MLSLSLVFGTLTAEECVHLELLAVRMIISDILFAPQSGIKVNES